MRDADFIAEAGRARMDIDPMSGERIEQLLARAYSAPGDVVARAAELVDPAGGK